jgi:hypothetical protein
LLGGGTRAYCCASKRPSRSCASASKSASASLLLLLLLLALRALLAVSVALCASAAESVPLRLLRALANGAVKVRIGVSHWIPFSACV